MSATINLLSSDLICHQVDTLIVPDQIIWWHIWREKNAGLENWRIKLNCWKTYSNSLAVLTFYILAECSKMFVLYSKKITHFTAFFRFFCRQSHYELNIYFIQFDTDHGREEWQIQSLMVWILLPLLCVLSQFLIEIYECGVNICE